MFQISMEKSRCGNRNLVILCVEVWQFTRFRFGSAPDNRQERLQAGDGPARLLLRRELRCEVKQKLPLPIRHSRHRLREKPQLAGFLFIVSPLWRCRREQFGASRRRRAVVEELVDRKSVV